MPYTNNKGADQPVLPCSLISAFVVRYLVSIIPLLATAEISRLGSLCSWGSRFESQLVANREDRFSRGVAHIVLTHATRNKNWSSLCDKGTSMQSQLSPRCSLTQYMSHRTTKPTKWPVGPVWSESSLWAWRILGSLATHGVHTRASDQTGRMPRLIWAFAGCTGHFIGFVMLRLIWN